MELQEFTVPILGGTGDDFPLSMFSDPQGNLVLMGRTYSTNFPGKLLVPANGEWYPGETSRFGSCKAQCRRHRT